MPDNTMEFSFSEGAVDRASVLEEAARSIDDRRTHLGGADEAVPETPEGQLLRALKDDIAELGDFPEVVKITDQDFLASQFKSVPAPFARLKRDYNFYWVRYPLRLFPRRNWAFNRLELYVNFNQDAPPADRPRAYQILPARQFQQLLELSDQLEVHLDENFQFSAKVSQLDANLPQAEASLGGGVGTDFSGGLGLVVGPFMYRWKRAKVEHTDTGLTSVFWRLDGAEFFQDDAPAFVTILQVPKDVENVQIDAELMAYRYFNFASAGLQDSIRVLSEKLQNWFKGGMPVNDRLDQPWDISARL